MEWVRIARVDLVEDLIRRANIVVGLREHVKKLFDKRSETKLVLYRVWNVIEAQLSQHFTQL